LSLIKNYFYNDIGCLTKAYIRGTLESISNSSDYLSCWISCQTNPACSFWSFDQIRKKCILIVSITGIQSSNNYISGSKNCRGIIFVINIFLKFLKYALRVVLIKGTLLLGGQVFLQFYGVFTLGGS